MRPEPTIDDFINAGTGAIRGRFSFNADTRRGSILEHFQGAPAIIWSREAQRDTDLFKNIRFDTADDAALTEYVSARWNINRTLDAYGTGTVAVSRPTAAAGAGYFREGTRILVASSYQNPVYYAVAQGTQVSAGALSAVIPIRAVVYGPGTTISTQFASFDDAVWDSSWKILNVTCGEGTLFEPAAQFRARVRDLLILDRKGYVDEMVTACANAGASHIVFFPSYMNGVTDFGLNVCYVGDDSYTGSSSLVKACKLALESSRVMGDQLQVLPMQFVDVPVTVTVYLWDDPSKFDLTDLDAVVRAAIVRYFDGGTTGGFQYDLDAIAGDIRAVTAAVQDVAFSAPASSATIMSGTPANFPATLSRYSCQPSHIQITWAPPQ